MARQDMFAGLTHRAVAARAMTVLQSIAIMLISLVAGSTFGIWRGYDPSSFSALTFLEVHQGAVRGLNVLLPAMGVVALLVTGGLAWLSRFNPPAARRYAIAATFMLVAALITRFGNQPINAQVMNWTPDHMPGDWWQLRDSWWHWHIVRTLVSICAVATLISAVLADRHQPRGSS